jgi:hypothetical protein
MKRIKKYNDLDIFWKEINESYENPESIRWIENENKLIGLFIVNNEIYKIECDLYDHDIWTYKFMKYDTISGQFIMYLIGDIGFKDKMTILGTIRKGMEYIIIEKSPNSLIFSALDDSVGRKKLYERFSEEIVNKYGFKYKTSLQNDKQIFILYKRIDIELILDVIKKNIISL